MFEAAQSDEISITICTIPITHLPGCVLDALLEVDLLLAAVPLF